MNMAILQRILRSAVLTERSLFFSSSRCVSRFHHHQSPTPKYEIGLGGSSLIHSNISNGLNSLSCSSVRKQVSHSLLPRIDMILPMSPVERLIKFQLPTVAKQVSLEMPTTKVSLDNAHINQKVVEYKAPPRGRVVKQYAVRMLVIRRRKMKKHQRKKYLKKFRIQLMTLHKKRSINKETVFLSGLENDMKLAEVFSAEEYAANKIRQAYKPLPEKQRHAKPLPWEFQPIFYNSQKRNEK